MSRYFIPLNVKSVHVPGAGECPDCLSKVTGAASASGSTPKPGDFGCCAMCGCMLRYMDNLEMRRMEDTEIDELEPEQRKLLLKYHRTFREVRNQMSQPGGPSRLLTILKDTQ